jgi:hypothetical protein
MKILTKEAAFPAAAAFIGKDPQLSINQLKTWTMLAKIIIISAAQSAAAAP